MAFMKLSIENVKIFWHFELQILAFWHYEFDPWQGMLLIDYEALLYCDEAIITF